MSRFSLRVRLASLIGLTLVVSGAALLAISYGLVSSNLSTPLLPAAPPTARMVPAQHGGTATRHTSSTFVPPVPAAVRAAETRTQSMLRKRTLDQLITQYLLALAGVVLVAMVLGWFFAGRLLRSLRRITSVAERITGRNLDARIGLNGPRDELRELAETFDQMLARLDAVFTAQRRFVADASHELRTPLAAMRVEIEVLAADPDAAVADVEAATRVLRRQLERGEQLIEALLALARSEPELLAREPVDLADIVRDARNDATANAEARRLRIDTELAPAVVEGDRRLLTLLTGNLLGNAVKHNQDGGWITLATDVESDAARLQVSNSGPAVAAEEVQELTQAFRRGGRARVGDGHGLGLALVQAVAHAHNGAITIESRHDGGLRVEISLPLAQTQPTGTPTMTTQEANGGKRTDEPAVTAQPLRV